MNAALGGARYPEHGHTVLRAVGIRRKELMIGLKVPPYKSLLEMMKCERVEASVRKHRS